VNVPPLASWPPMFGGRKGSYSVASLLVLALMWFANDAQGQLRELRDRMARMESQIERIADRQSRCAGEKRSR